MRTFGSRFRFSYLLYLLVFLLFTYPYFRGGGLNRAIQAVVYSGVMLTAVHAVGGTRRHSIGGLVLGIPYLVSIWVMIVAPDATWGVTTAGLGTAFFLYTTVVLLLAVLRTPRITTETIYGALCCYLLFGITWAHAYALLSGLDTNAFRGVDGSGPDGQRTFADFLYYSYVTLTTLGYGDVVPSSAKAKSLAMMEAITGVIFVAVQIARLVGMRQPEEE